MAVVCFFSPQKRRKHLKIETQNINHQEKMKEKRVIMNPSNIAIFKFRIICGKDFCEHFLCYAHQSICT